MLKLILIFITAVIKLTNSFNININDFIDDDSFCKYLHNDKILIDKQLYYNNLYDNDNEARNELNNERKKIDQMIYQLCNKMQ
jgi:hypothetical protein